MYQLLPDTPMGAAQCIKRLADSAFIPFDEANTDYQRYLAWLAEGNEPIPLDRASNGQLTAVIVGQIQQRLDDFARTRGYDSVLSACTYATSSVPKFQTEGQYCVAARDATWATTYEILAEVEAGTRPVPVSISDIEAELPPLAWPA